MSFDAASLAAPFPADAVSWRAQTMNQAGNSAMALAYIDARDVMRRLDEVCGPENWSDSYTETPKGRVIATIAVRIGDDWVSKADGAGDTDVEGAKGGLSDAFKRAAVKWGIGRYLYDLDAVWAECETYERNGKKHWKKWTAAGERKLRDALGGNVSRLPSPSSATELPASVQAMIAGLEAASRNGEKAMTDYWVANWPGVPREHRTQVVAAKERIKAAAERKAA